MDHCFAHILWWTLVGAAASILKLMLTHWPILIFFVHEIRRVQKMNPEDSRSDFVPSFFCPRTRPRTFLQCFALDSFPLF